MKSIIELPIEVWYRSFIARADEVIE